MFLSLLKRQSQQLDQSVNHDAEVIAFCVVVFLVVALFGLLIRVVSKRMRQQSPGKWKVAEASVTILAVAMVISKPVVQKMVPK